MQRFHKTLGICILLTAVVYAVIKMVGGVGFDVKADGDAKARSRDLIVRDERGEKSSDASTRKLRIRARKLTSAEATEFLKATIIPRIDFENITLEDALKIVNAEIEKQTSDDQPRPRILLDPKFDAIRWLDLGDAGMHEIKPASLSELRLRNVPVVFLLKYMCDMTKTSYWVYKGDIYIGNQTIGYSQNGNWLHPDFFYNQEKLSRLNLEDIDASQLASKLNEVIDQQDYFGPKLSIDIMMSEKARDALLKGEVPLPRLNLDLKNITLQEAIIQIAEETGGALMPHGRSLLFNPFKEDGLTDDPFVPVTYHGVPFDIKLDEDTFKPKSDDDLLKK